MKFDRDVILIPEDILRFMEAARRFEMIPTPSFGYARLRLSSVAGNGPRITLCERRRRTLIGAEKRVIFRSSVTHNTIP